MPISGNIGVANLQIIDPVLTKILIGYKPAGFILDELLTKVPVDTSFGRIPKFAGNMLKVESDIVIGAGNIPSVSVKVTSTDTFEVKMHALKMYYTNTDAQQWGGVSATEAIYNNKLADMLLLGREKAFATALTTAASYAVANTSSPATAWSDYVNSDPLSDFKTARAAVKASCGMSANVAIMSWDVFNTLISHPKLVTVALGFAYDGNFTGTLNELQVAKAMGVKKIYVGEAYYNSAELGQTQVLSPIWGSGNCVFAYVNQQITPTMAQQSLGYSFIPSSALLSKDMPILMGYPDFAYTYTDPDKMSWMGKWVVQGRMYDDNILDINCGYLFTSAI